MYVVLCGGVGGSRLLTGLAAVCPPDELTAVVNTGDDFEVYGLYVSPDIDINVYALAGVVHPAQGWGISGDSYRCQSFLHDRYGLDNWFQLGDLDLGTHIFRTWRMRQGFTLSQVTEEMCERWNVSVRLLPMTDQRVATHILTPSGEMHFQEYLVRRKMTDEVKGVRFAGIEDARPAPGLLEAIARADAVIIGPSNPVVSVDPILQVAGVRDAIEASRAKVVAVSPIIAGQVVKGPLARMFSDLGREVSPVGVVEYYGGLIDVMVVDEQDRHLLPELERRGVAAFATHTWMDSDDSKRALARFVIDLARGGAGRRFRP